LPEELKDASLFSPLSVIWLSIGLLSAVLTPCMLQLSMMYFAVLSGSTAWLKDSELNEQDKNQLIQKKMMHFALAFIVGFVVLFGAIGALIGWSGQLMQAYFAMYETQISVSSGLVVLAFGLYLAHQARMPMVCRMPMGKLTSIIQNNSLVSSSLLSVGYSLGCITCFGGAIIGTLMIYVGTLESPILGASIMGLFAIGVGVPFLIAAIMMSRVQGILDIMMKFQRPIQLFTAVVVLFFGMVLVTDNYHTISDFLAPFMGL
jgi:cytochrome c-type biogenesis protein